MARNEGHWQSERCTVCSHPKIGIRNFALARGISPLALANEHGLGTSAMYNHNRAHIEDNHRKIIDSGDIDEIELRAKINRELAPATTYSSITNNVVMMGDVTELLKILQPFPEARQAIVDHYNARSATKAPVPETGAVEPVKPPRGGIVDLHTPIQQPESTIDRPTVL